MNVSTSLVDVTPVAAPSAATRIGSALGDLAGTGLAAYETYKAFQLGSGSNARFEQGLAVANLINSVAGASIAGPYALLQGVANVQVKLAHDYFANQKAKHEARRALRNAGHTFARSTGAGHNPVIAARLAIARIGLNPEQYVPLGSSDAQFSPRTRAVDTEEGLIADFGEGAEADAVREMRAVERGQDLDRRLARAAGLGLVPPALGRFRR